MDLLPPECQYLGSEHVQESDVGIIGLHLETLYLLATRGGVEGRRGVRSGGTYAVVRELHLGVEDEAVRRGCERLVDVLMGEELEGDIGDGGKGGRVGGDEGKGGGRMVTQADVGEEDEEEDEIVPIF